MPKKIIEVTLPFKMCEWCGAFELTSNTIYADGNPCFSVYGCANESMCNRIVKNIDKSEQTDCAWR